MVSDPLCSLGSRPFLVALGQLAAAEFEGFTSGGGGIGECLGLFLAGRSDPAEPHAEPVAGQCDLPELAGRALDILQVGSLRGQQAGVDARRLRVSRRSRISVRGWCERVVSVRLCGQESLEMLVLCVQPVVAGILPAFIDL